MGVSPSGLQVTDRPDVLLFCQFSCHHPVSQTRTGSRTHISLLYLLIAGAGVSGLQIGEAHGANGVKPGHNLLHRHIGACLMCVF